MKELMKKYGWTEPFIPMNVKNSDKKLESLFTDDTYIAELKRDGSRYLCIDGRFFSRKKSENKKKPESLGMPVEKTANVPHLAEVFSKLEGFIFDGEIHYPGGKSNATTSVMGCDAWKAHMRQGFGYFGTDEKGDAVWSDTADGDWLGEVQKLDKDYEKLKFKNQPIHYMIFDLLMVDGQDLTGHPWEERRFILEGVLKDWIYDPSEGRRLIDHPFIHLSEYVEGEQEKRNLLKWTEDNKEEGIVFKNRGSIYQCDKRPEHHWYRKKGKIYADVVIMGYTEGEGKYKGLIGSIEFGLYKDGDLWHAGTCSGMNDELRKDITDHPDTYYGQVMEVSAMERTAKGLFRHPQFERFRDDKNAQDCLWEVEVDG